MLPCLFKKTTGIDCIGCGMQRSLWLLFQGDVADAIKMYPPICTFVPFMLLLGLYLFDKKRNYTKFVIFFAILNAVVMVISYIYKMTNN